MRARAYGSILLQLRDFAVGAVNGEDAVREQERSTERRRAVDTRGQTSAARCVDAVPGLEGDQHQAVAGAIENEAPFHILSVHLERACPLAWQRMSYIGR